MTESENGPTLESALEKAHQGDFPGARMELENLIRQSPDSAHANYYLGLVCVRLEDLHVARAAFEKCLELDPFYHEAREQLKQINIPPAPPHPPAPLSSMEREVESPLPTLESGVMREVGEGDKTYAYWVKPAGFWIRFLAVLFDTIMTTLAIEPFTRLVSIPFYPFFAEYEGMSEEEMVDQILQQVMMGNTRPLVMALLFSLALMTLAVAINMVVFSYFHYASGQTLGKRLFRIRVVDRPSLGYLSLGQSIGRYAASQLSYCLCLIGYLMAGFNSEKLALHDYLASTRVVYSENVPLTTGESLMAVVLVFFMALGGLLLFFL